MICILQLNSITVTQYFNVKCSTNIMPEYRRIRLGISAIAKFSYPWSGILSGISPGIPGFCGGPGGKCGPARYNQRTILIYSRTTFSSLCLRDKLTRRYLLLGVVVWRKWGQTKIGIRMTSTRKWPLIWIWWERVISRSRRWTVARRKVVKIWRVWSRSVIQTGLWIKLTLWWTVRVKSYRGRGS